MDACGNLRDVNDKAVELLHYSKERLLGKHFSQFPFWSAETKTKLGKLFAQRIAGAEIPPYEIDFVRKDGQTLVGQIHGALLRNDAGDVTHSLIIVTDVTERTRMEKETRHREAFERIMTRLSSEFVDVGNLDDGVNHAIETIGRFCAADRAYVFLVRADGKTVDNTHEWCAEGVEAQIGNLQGIVVEETLPWFWKCMQDRKAFPVTAVRDLPPKARLEKEHFEMQDIRSLTVVPMVCDDALVGFVGFDCVRAERIWPEDEVGLLRIVADTVARAVVRKAMEDALVESEEKFRSFVENANDIVYSSSLEGAFVYISRMCAGCLDTTRQTSSEGLLEISFIRTTCRGATSLSRRSSLPAKELPTWSAERGIRRAAATTLPPGVVSAA